MPKKRTPQVSFKWTAGAEAALDAALRKSNARSVGPQDETRAQFARRKVLEAVWAELGEQAFNALVLDEEEREVASAPFRNLNPAFQGVFEDD